MNLEERRHINVIENNNNQSLAEPDPNKWWDFSRDTCIYVYSGITIATVILTLIRSFSFFIACMRASTRLHDTMFKSITRATMRFFNTNTSGRILNRFSKDMGAIDELVPNAMVDCLQVR